MIELDDRTGQSITDLVYRGENYDVKVVASGVEPDVGIKVGIYRYPISYVDLFWKTFGFRCPFLGFLESIELIQSYQSLKVNRVNHLLYENEMTQSLIT